MLPDTSSVCTAIAILKETVPIDGTPAEIYAIWRRIPRHPFLRFHPSLDHPDGGTWPAMIAAITNDEYKPVAVHVTFLANDGRERAPVLPGTMVIGSGIGHAVRLAPPEAGHLIIGINLEACLQATAYWQKPVWATLSLEGLAALQLPSEVRDVVILTAIGHFSLQTAHAFRIRCAREGRIARVRTLLPPDFEYYFYSEDDFPL